MELERRSSFVLPGIGVLVQRSQWTAGVHFYTVAWQVPWGLAAFFVDCSRAAGDFPQALRDFQRT